MLSRSYRRDIFIKSLHRTALPQREAVAVIWKHRPCCLDHDHYRVVTMASRLAPEHGPSNTVELHRLLVPCLHDIPGSSSLFSANPTYTLTLSPRCLARASLQASARLLSELKVYWHRDHTMSSRLEAHVMTESRLEYCTCASYPEETQLPSPAMASSNSHSSPGHSG
jgi:hypothetical protein